MQTLGRKPHRPRSCDGREWRIRLVILDFDGTLTDVHKEAVPYVRHYKIAVAGALRMDARGLSVLWNRTRRSLLLDQTKGWEEEGIFVAPMTADPMVETRVVARHILGTHNFTPQNGKSLSDFQQELFRQNYPRCLIRFKQNAGNFVRQLRTMFEHVLIVTNSGTETVRKKLSMLGLADLPKKAVRGDAKKYKPHWDEQLSSLDERVPLFIHIDGFGREIFLKRGYYARVLLGIMHEFNLQPENILVVGDIPELDLVLPAQLGMHTMLVAGRNTQDFERKLVLAQGGIIVDTLTECLNRITEITSAYNSSR